MSDDDVPRVELAPDWELEEPDRQQQSPEEVAESLRRLMYENYSEETLRTVLGDEFDESEFAKAELRGDFDYEECDDALFEAHEKSVMWQADRDPSDVDLSKAPGIWTSDDRVPDEVQDILEAQIRGGQITWGQYETLPPGGEAKVAEILERQLTQPQGWSLESLIRELREFYDTVTEAEAANIFRNETSSVLNVAREELYEMRDDAETYVYDWVGPTDHRATEICRSIEDVIESRGGAVPLPELKEILRTSALAHESGTPERVDQWNPHFQCRRTFVRRVQTI